MPGEGVDFGAVGADSLELELFGLSEGFRAAEDPSGDRPGVAVTVCAGPTRTVGRGPTRRRVWGVDRLTFNGAIIETGTQSCRLAHTKARQQLKAVT